MPFIRIVLLLLIPGVLVAQDDSASGPPRLNSIHPPAWQRGVENSIQIVGKAHAKTTGVLLPFEAKIHVQSSNTETVGFTVTPSEQTPVGVYPVRVFGSYGVSNLRLVTVTDVPVIRTRDPNGRFKDGLLDLESAVRIEPPCLVTGGRLSGDLDLLRFSVPAGARRVIVTQSYATGLTPDPVFWLRGPDRKSLAWAHDTPGLRRDERLDYRFRQSGDYWLEIRSTGGGGWTNQYLLKIGDFDYARSVFPLGGRRGDETEFTITGRDGQKRTVTARVPDDPALDLWQLPLPKHSGSLAWTLAAGEHPEVLEDELETELETAAGPLVNWPVTINGRISESGQANRFRLRVEPGQQIRATVEANFLGSALDGYLLAYDRLGKQLLAQADDQVYRGNPDPALGFTVPDGVTEVTIELRDTLNKGGIEYGYRLTIEHGGPDFYLWLGKKQNPFRNDGWLKWDASDTLNLPRGGSARLTVSVRRESKKDDSYYKGPVEGFQGPIELKAVGLPDGVTADPVTIPAGETEAQLTFRATADAPRSPFEFAVVGEGKRKDGRVLRHFAQRKLFLSEPQMTHLPWNWRVRKVTCVVTSGGKNTKTKQPRSGDSR